MSRLGAERWRAVSPHLDRALSLCAEDRAALVLALKQSEPSVAADLEALLEEDLALDRVGFLEGRPDVPGATAATGGEEGGRNPRSGPYRPS